MPTTKFTLPFGTFYIEVDGKKVPFEVEDVTMSVNERNTAWHRHRFGEAANVERAVLLVPKLPEQFSYDTISLYGLWNSKVNWEDSVSDEGYYGVYVKNERYAISYGGGENYSFGFGTDVYEPKNTNQFEELALIYAGTPPHSLKKLTPKLRSLIMFEIAYKPVQAAEKVERLNKYGDLSLDFALDEIFCRTFDFYRQQKG